MQNVSVCFTLCRFGWVLPVMMTFEAPIALATSKQTNPIGPGERGKIKSMSIAEIHHVWLETCLETQKRVNVLMSYK